MEMKSIKEKDENDNLAMEEVTRRGRQARRKVDRGKLEDEINMSKHDEEMNEKLTWEELKRKGMKGS